MTTWQIKGTVDKRYIAVELDDAGREINRLGPVRTWKLALRMLSMKLMQERGRT